MPSLSLNSARLEETLLVKARIFRLELGGSKRGQMFGGNALGGGVDESGDKFEMLLSHTLYTAGSVPTLLSD